MGVVKDMFSSPKLPKTPEVPAPVEDSADAIGKAAVEARRAARRRLGMLSLVTAGSAAGGLTGTPRTQSGGLTA